MRLVSAITSSRKGLCRSCCNARSLVRDEPRIGPVTGNEFGMTAGFHDPPGLHHQDRVGVLDRILCPLENPKIGWRVALDTRAFWRCEVFGFSRGRSIAFNISEKSQHLAVIWTRAQVSIHPPGWFSSLLGGNRVAMRVAAHGFPFASRHAHSVPR